MAHLLKHIPDSTTTISEKPARKGSGKPVTACAQHVIFITDDDPVLLDVLTVHPDLAQYHFVLTADGEEALDLLSLYRPALVILDWRRPTIGGRRLLATIREWYGNNVPILVLSAEVEAGDMHVDAFMPKPCAIEHVVGTIHRLLAA